MSSQNQKTEQSEIKKHFYELGEKWKSAFVSRDQVGVFSGGIITSRYVANLDSLGEGPEIRFRSGRKVCYPVQSLIEWLIRRSTRL